MFCRNLDGGSPHLLFIQPNPRSLLLLAVHHRCNARQLRHVSGVQLQALEPVGIRLREVVGCENTRFENILCEDVPEQGNVVGDAPDNIVVQGVNGGADSLVS